MNITIKRRARKGRKRFFIKPHLKYVYSFFMKHCSVDESSVLLESFHGKTVGDSAIVMAREILRLYPGRYKLYFATKDMEAHSRSVSEEGLNVELVSINTARYVKILAASRCIISNASLPTYFIRREGQTYLQTWHGTPLKTLGRKMRFGIESMYNVQHNFVQASYILQPNEFTRKAIMEDYFLEELYTGKVIMSGYPRNQIFMQKERSESIRKRLGLGDKTVYAYMPTWRGTSNHTIETDGYFDEVREIFGKLDPEMKDDQVMYVNFHPIIQGSFDFSGYRHIRPFPKEVDSYSFLSASDCLVTDYSSVFFDYALTGKPVVLFMYDYDKYIHDRNLYMDVRDLPFRQIFDEDEFIRCIADGGALADSYSDDGFMKSFMRFESPDNPEKILKLILEGEDESIRKTDIESWRERGGESLTGGDENGLAVLDYSGNKDRKLDLYMPDHIDRESDLQTFQQICEEDEGSVVLLLKSWFNGRDMSRLLYDKYNRIRYVVMTSDTEPDVIIAQAEDQKKGRKSRLPAYRDYLGRYLPGRTVKEVIVDGYGIFRDKCQVRPCDVVLTGFTLGNYGPASLDISIKDAKGLRIREKAVLDNKNTIMRRIPAGEEELDSLTFRFDFREEIENCMFPNKRFAAAGLICEDGEGRPKLLKFTDEERLRDFDPKHKIKRKMSYDPVRYTCMLPEGFMKRKTGFIYYSQEEDAEREEQEVALLPVLNSDRSLDFRICGEDKLIEFAGNTAELADVKCGGSGITIEAVLKGWKIGEVKTAVLKNADSEGLAVPMETDICEKDGDVAVSASLAGGEDLPLSADWWYPLVIMRFGGREYELKVTSRGRTKEQDEYHAGIRTEISGYVITAGFTDFGTFRLRARRAPKKEPPGGEKSDSLLGRLRKIARKITG